MDTLFFNDIAVILDVFYHLLYRDINIQLVILLMYGKTLLIWLGNCHKITCNVLSFNIYGSFH